MALLQGQVGIQNAAEGGNPITVRMGRGGDVLTSQLHGDYREAAFRRAIFVGSNGATPTVTTVALATTYTGLALINPAASTVNLSVLKVGLSFLVVFPAVSTLGIMTGHSPLGTTTFTAAATDGLNSVFPGQRGQGRAALSATLVGTPQLHTVVGSGLTGAVTTVPTQFALYDLEGSLEIPPGGYAAIYTSTVCGAASMCASFMWEECPI
jgi:hypothetical protein